MWTTGTCLKSIFIIACFILRCRSYDCIFGFSAGHVGTGTLGAYQSYQNTSHVKFFFEGRNLESGARCFVEPQDYSKGFTVTDEENFVKKKLLPFMNNAIRNQSIQYIVDLGHSDLFYYRGIAKYFLTRKNRSTQNSFCRKLHFVRIRRERYETMESLSVKNNHGSKLKKDVCSGDVFFSLCPFQNTASVVIPPPPRHVWNRNMTIFQQMLYVIDETEARWQVFKSSVSYSHHITTSELYWSSKGGEQNSFRKALEHIAELINTTAVPDDGTPKLHVHSDQEHTSLDDARIKQYRDIEIGYAHAMKQK